MFKEVAYHFETRRAGAIRWSGFAVWMVCWCLALYLGNRELFASSGAVGICFLLAYIHVERGEVLAAESRARDDFYGPLFGQLNLVKYDDLSDDMKQGYEEA